MPERTVRAVLARNGRSRLPTLDADEPANRYERPAPGELIHIDVKKLGRIAREGKRINGDPRTRSRGIGWEFVHVAIDDCARLAYVEVLNDERTDTVIAFFERAVAWFADQGIEVEWLMTDNGSAYRSHAHAAACRALGIRHLFTQPYRPRTNGKAERFIRTLLTEWAYAAAYPTSAARTRALPAFLTRYNHHRPHQALDGTPPAERLTERTNPTAAYTCGGAAVSSEQQRTAVADSVLGSRTDQFKIHQAAEPIGQRARREHELPGQLRDREHFVALVPAHTGDDLVALSEYEQQL